MPQLESVANVWLERIPKLEDGRRNPGLDPAAAAKLFDDLLKQGESAINSVIGSLGDIDNGKDWKTRLLLHGLVIHTGAQDRQKDRARLEQFYAAALLDERSAATKTFLAMQLQWFATGPAVPALAAQLASDDIQLVNAAAAALTAIGEPAVEALKRAQSKAAGPAKTAIDHALKQIR
ncbi:MAG: hypothetical protein ACI9HK_002136 [Pirellulaceae bacterium]|jgi:hypothetical protein